jgi:PDZ domain
MMEPRTLLLTATLGLCSPLLAQDPGAARPAPERQAPPAAEAPTEVPTDKAGEKAKTRSVAECIADLGSSSYRTRLAAERALREIGKDAVPALEKAVADADDPEVQWRARRVLRQIQGGSGGLVDRDTERSGTEAEGETAEVTPPSRGGRRGGLQPRAGQNRSGTDPVRDQFESLFERFERDFGIDIPRARFFEDGFFRDLHEQMQGQETRSQGMSVQIGPDGAVHVEVQQRNDKGEVEKKVYDAPDMETFQRQHPGVLQQNGLRMGLSPFGGGGVDWPNSPLFERSFRFGPQGFQPLDPRGRAGEPQGVEIEPPAPPPAGRRLGIAIQPEIPAPLRSYLELPEGTGLMVESVQDGSLAAALGLQKGDIITRIGERQIGSPQDVQDALGPIEKGAEVKVTFVRRGAVRTATAAKTEATAAPTAPKSERLQPRAGASIR